MPILRLASLVLCFFAAPSFAQSSSVIIQLDTRALLGNTEITYASWNIDPSCNRGFHSTDFSNPNLLAVAKGLAPSRLRFGGSGADFLTYSFAPGAPDCPPPDPAAGCHYVTPGCLNATQGGALLDFGAAAGVEFIFGVAFNLTAACAGLPWDAANAARLIDFLNATGRKVWGFELGNVRLARPGAPAQPCRARVSPRAPPTPPPPLRRR